MTNEEQTLINSVEQGEWQSVENLNALKKSLMQAAAETALKDSRINKGMAKRNVSVLHKYATGQVVEK